MFGHIWFKGLNAPETTKTEDMRQCTLCQQYGDSAPFVSLAVFLFVTFTFPLSPPCVYPVVWNTLVGCKKFLIIQHL